VEPTLSSHDIGSESYLFQFKFEYILKVLYVCTFTSMALWFMYTDRILYPSIYAAACYLRALSIYHDTSIQFFQVTQYLSLPEPRDPDCRLLRHVKIVLGSAHCEALSRFKQPVIAQTLDWILGPSALVESLGVSQRCLIWHDGLIKCQDLSCEKCEAHKQCIKHAHL
jgi:hypothetical protein